MVSSPDALHQSVDVGVEPHRYSLVQNEGACLLVHERAAAGGDHLRFPVDQPGDDPPLAVAEMRLAELLEDFADGAARRRLYLVIGIEERQPEPYGQAAAKPGFARPHQHEADERARQSTRLNSSHSSAYRNAAAH